MDHQEQFVSELHNFAGKFRRAAGLHLTPDLNYGVVFNIAPLWELVPWKEAKKYWEEPPKASTNGPASANNCRKRLS